MLRDKISNEQIIAALEKHHSIVSTAALELGIVRKTLSIWIKEDEELQEAQREAREGLKDLVESQLLKNVKRGKEASVIFAAKTIAKDRGYVERQEFAEHIEQPLFGSDEDDDPTDYEDTTTYNGND